MATFTLWNAPQACLWIASRDEMLVARLKENHTFAELAMETEVAWDDEAWDGNDDPEAFPPLPGWIGRAQKELLGACVRGAIKLMGRPSSGGVSEEIPGPACATARFFCESLERGECLGPPGTPPGDYWTDIQVVADDVRRVWPVDRSAAAASSPSIPATAARSAASPTYTPSEKYSPDKVPNQFKEWARAQHEAGVIITEALAQDAMRGPKDDHGKPHLRLAHPRCGAIARNCPQVDQDPPGRLVCRAGRNAVSP
jgi:hypothetical protein